MVYSSITTQQKIKEHSIVSFDIFDTLIIRPYINPTDVFHHIERNLNLKRYAQARIKAEKKARSHALEDEISFAAIYDRIDKKFKKAAPYELEFEKQVCIQNPEIFALYQEAIRLNKRVIFVSDMYLPEEAVKEILQKAGYDKYDHLFLSSSAKKRKHTGKLFDEVIQKYNVPQEKILHIGDNRENDYNQARKKGINAILYPKVMDRFLENYPNLKFLLYKNYDSRFKVDPLSISIILGLNAVLWVSNPNRSYWTHVGALYAGPFLYYFSRWIYDSAKKKNIKNIALAARDGYNLLKIINLFNSKNELNPQYVYLPRHVSETSNINTLDDLKTFFQEIGKTCEALETFIIEFSKESTKIQKAWELFSAQNPKYTHESLQEFILHHQEAFLKTSLKKREIVKEYLNHLNLLSDDLIVVDSSCTKARPQNLLNKIIAEDNLGISLQGLYYKINNPQRHLAQIDVRPRVDRKYQTDKWDLMEFFMSSPEKPILSIGKTNNGFFPVYKAIESNKHEEVRIRASELLSDGINDFAKLAYKIFGDSLIIKDLDTAVAYVNQYINYPGIQDISYLKHLYHSVNNDDEYAPILLKDNIFENNLRKIHGQRVNVKRVTPELENYFNPLHLHRGNNAEENSVVALNVASGRPDSVGTEEALIMKGKNESFREIARTKLWSQDNAINIFLIPGTPKKIIYNDYDSPSKKAVGIFTDMSTGESVRFAHPILHVSHDGKWVLWLDEKELPSEGTPINTPGDISNLTLLNKTISIANTRIVLSSISDNAENIDLPFSSIIEAIHPGAKDDTDQAIIQKISFFPEQNRLFLVIRLIISESSPLNYIVSTDFSGEVSYSMRFELAAYCWKDRQSIYAIGKDKPDSNAEALYTIHFTKKEIETINKTHFHGVRHFSAHPKGDYIIFESSPEQEIPYRKLQLFDIKKQNTVVLGYFYSPNINSHIIGNPTNSLRPHWVAQGDFIFLESRHEGFKAVYTIPGHEAIGELSKAFNIISEEEIQKTLKLISSHRNKGFYQLVKQKMKNRLKPIIYRARRLVNRDFLS